MSAKTEIIGYLEREKLFRERKNKDRGMVNLLMNKYHGLREAIEKRMLTKDMLTEIVQEYATMDRAWRQALEQHEHLRGSDYGAKDHLEAQKQAELGYNVPPLRP